MSASFSGWTICVMKFRKKKECDHMKKLFSLLLAAAMVLTMAACGTTNAGNDAADEPKNDVTTDAANPAPTEETPESTAARCW